MKEVTELLSAIASLAWPALAAVALYFLYPFAKVLMSRDKVKIKIGEMELSAEQATESISNQVKDLQNKLLEIERRLPERAQTSATNEAPFDLEAAPANPQRRILWVDDKPSNNAIQVDKLRNEGWQVELALTTAEALDKFDDQKFDLIISDMGRREDGISRPTAGIDLAEEIRSRDSQIPIIVFTTHQALSRFQVPAKKAGISVLTNSTVELYRQLESAVGKG